jgi:hypothetical protein
MLKNHSDGGIDMAKTELTVPSGSGSEFNTVTLKRYEEICIWENCHQQAFSFGASASGFGASAPSFGATKVLYYNREQWTTPATTDIQLKLNISIFAISHT